MDINSGKQKKIIYNKKITALSNSRKQWWVLSIIIVLPNKQN
jgi:hypothetical protein